jgi:hypothetical protein
MEIQRACDLLELKRCKSLTEKDVKRAYFCQARKYHPDKLKQATGIDTITFIEIQDAYTCVLQWINDPTRYVQPNVSEMKEYLFTTLGLQPDNCVRYMMDFITEFKLQLDKDSYALLQQLILDYYRKSPFHKEGNTYRVTLQPTLDNLLNHDIYSLVFHEETYYIPLWHEQVEFLNETCKVVVNIEPILPNGIFKDDDNVLYVHHTLSIHELLGKETYDIFVGKRKFTINVNELKLQPYQCIPFLQSGIADISTTSIFSIDRLNPVYIYIEFKELP